MVLEEFVQSILRSSTGSSNELLSIVQLTGGDINDVYRTETTNGNYCLKINENCPQDFFEAEAHGIALLAKSSFQVPEVIEYGSNFLLLEYIKQGQKTHNFWQDFGRCLAELHQIEASSFGLDRNNYIGTLKQENNRHLLWSTFYMEERIIPLLNLAIENGYLSENDLETAYSLIPVLKKLDHKTKPSLIHGDLWSGNYLIGDQGIPAIIDPATYFGNREIDIAMTRMFGGFGEEMYIEYNRVFPLEKGWEDRLVLYQLYPLLVHVNLFGGHYVERFRKSINNFKY